MAICKVCDDEYSDGRKELGYRSCLDCGQEAAEKEILRKAKCSAPAYNKGGYMYISSVKMAKDLGR